MSDLVIEFGIANDDIQPVVAKIGAVEITRIDIDSARLAQKYSREQGVYYSIDAAKSDDKSIMHAVYTCLDKLLRHIKGKVLVVGLGNPRYVADAFGTRVIDAIGAKCGLLKLYPLVSGETGVESCDIVKAVVDRIKPAAVIAIDTLATSEKSRLGNIYQLTDSGIVPGSGAGSARGVINAESLGVPFFALGVPLVLKIDDEIFTSAYIDAIIAGTAKIVGAALEKWAMKAH